MTRIAPPLLGYNNNVRYQGRTFHIQTEDSGTKYARIMTHLFMDGGRIVKTTKTDYGALLGEPGLVETVRRMMKEQHKGMFLSLRGGEFDAIIERVLQADGAPPSIVPALSQIPRLRADSLPSLAFGAGEEPKTMPGLPPFVVDSSLHPELGEPDLPDLAASTVSQPEAPKRPSVRPRKSKSLAPATSRRGLLADEPTPTDLPEAIANSASNRPSERPSRQLAVRPATLTQEALDPRTQSIFGEAAAGRQTLDEVILSFLEDEDS